MSYEVGIIHSLLNATLHHIKGFEKTRAVLRLKLYARVMLNTDETNIVPK